MPRILVPIDGSALSLAALQHALALRRDGLRAEFVLANVQEPASLYEMITLRDPQALAAMEERAGDHLLERARDLCDAAGASYACEVAMGDPAHTLLDIAEREGCDMVVMGAHGQGDPGEESDLGPVAEVVARMAAIPVTVVRRSAHIGATLPLRAEAGDGMDAVVGLA
jgi:nucleotide-binding universal stress UspA family protein